MVLRVMLLCLGFASRARGATPAAAVSTTARAACATRRSASAAAAAALRRSIPASTVKMSCEGILGPSPSSLQTCRKKATQPSSRRFVAVRCITCTVGRVFSLKCSRNLLEDISSCFGSRFFSSGGDGLVLRDGQDATLCGPMLRSLAVWIRCVLIWGVTQLILTLGFKTLLTLRAAFLPLHADLLREFPIRFTPF